VLMKNGAMATVGAIFVAIVFAYVFARWISWTARVEDITPPIIYALADQLETDVGDFRQYSEDAVRTRLFITLLFTGVATLVGILIDRILDGFLKVFKLKLDEETLIFTFIAIFFITALYVILLRTPLLPYLFEVFSPYDVSFSRNDVIGMQGALVIGLLIPLMYRLTELSVRIYLK
jgi:hypothetical protein